VTKFYHFHTTKTTKKNIALFLSLKVFAKNITNCSNSKSFCEDSSGYPTEEVDKLLSSHLQQEYFKDVLGEHTEKACSHTTEATIGNVITGGIIIRKPYFT